MSFTNRALALAIATTLGACSLMDFGNEDDKSTSANQSSSSGNNSSSSIALNQSQKDSLMKFAEEMLDPNEISMIKSLSSDCQVKYLSMSLGENSAADAAFFGDASCFMSVVQGMTPTELSADCKSLYQAPFEYYSKNWQGLQACQDPEQTGAANCDALMDPLKMKTDAFYSQCGDKAGEFPWDRNHMQDTTWQKDSTQFMDPEAMRKFCAEPMNAEKPECVQFAKCDPLHQKMGQLNYELGLKIAACGEDMNCVAEVKNSSQVEIQSIQQQLEANQCFGPKEMQQMP